MTRRVRLPRSPAIAEPIPPVESPEPIVLHEDGGWSIWHDAERYPSRNFAEQVHLRQTRHQSHWLKQ
jgi:hypothetical protein